MKNKNILGKRFGRLKVLSFNKKDKHCATYWKCICDCGAETIVRIDHLNSGRIKSCGCLNREKTIKRNLERKTHGKTKTRTYKVWTSMIRRCFSPNDKDFHNYGGRGIAVCEEWRLSFENFLTDMGEQPRGRTIDRIDNNGSYCKENCRWANRYVQAQNRRTNNLRTYKGKALPVVEWAKRYNIPSQVIYDRLRNGWPFVKCIETPVRKYKRVA